MEVTNKRIRVKALYLDQLGYGIDGKLTRQQWQDECLEMVLSGRDSFNSWQIELQHIASISSSAGRFEWEISYADESKSSIRLGWSDSVPAFVVDLTGRVFEKSLSLSGYRFLTGVSFMGASFNIFATFHDVSFARPAYFQGAQFKQGALFKASFDTGCIFDHCVFESLASFGYSQCSGSAIFRNVTFQEDAHFYGTTLKHATFDGATFSKSASFWGDTVNNDNKVQVFGQISFLGTHFSDRADFSDREFMGRISFGAYEGQCTQFDVVPYFFNCRLHQDTTFLDVSFPVDTKKDKDAARAYSALRHAMSQQQATREEQRFLKLEFDAERSVSDGRLRWIYALYKNIADYGFSLSKPVFYLLFIPFLCAILFYGILSSIHHCISLTSPGCQFDANQTLEVISFAFLQGLPPLGLEKISDSLRQALFGDGADLFFLAITGIAQKVLSLIGWFLVALALRNLFRMK